MILYYSAFCDHCAKLLLALSRSQLKQEIHFICLDKRETDKKGQTNIITEGGDRVLLPVNVKAVPTLLLLHHGHRVLEGTEAIQNYLRPKEATINDVATEENGEPKAYSIFEMGTSLSDQYSYLDMTADELSAKGSGGLRQMHNFSKVGDNGVIATPPDEYVADKLGPVDLSKIMEARAKEVRA